MANTSYKLVIKKGFKIAETREPSYLNKELISCMGGRGGDNFVEL